jgi:hypothetical protein
MRLFKQRMPYREYGDEAMNKDSKREIEEYVSTSVLMEVLEISRSTGLPAYGQRDA